MNNNEAVERLKLFAICHGLPQTDMALFGIKCPYCGKSDRIRALEKPDEKKNGIKPEGLLKWIAEKEIEEFPEKNSCFKH